MPMRRLLAISLLCAACGARAHGPPWPKSAGPDRVGAADDDAGESLAPRQPTSTTAVEQSADDDAGDEAAVDAEGADGDNPDADTDADSDESPAAGQPAGDDGPTIEIEGSAPDPGTDPPDPDGP